MAEVTLIVIEDNRLLREGLATMLRRSPGLVVVATCADAAQAMRDVPRTRPRLVLLDIGLAEDDSLALCQQLRAAVPETMVVVMGVGAPEEDVADFIRAGAAGFIMKDASVEEFVATLRLVAAGEQALPRALTQSLFAQILRGEKAPSRALVDESIRLTTRERQIIDLLGEGLSNKEIGARLYISVHTVKSHVHNILEKLSLHTRLQVAAYARGTGSSDD